MRYYCYRHIRLDTNKPFYIGIGTKRKVFEYFEQEFARAYNFNCRSEQWKKIYLECNKQVLVEIILESDDKKDIIKKEEEFIKLYGRLDKGNGSLANLTNGGEKLFAGIVMTKSRKEAIRKSLIGKKWSNKKLIRIRKQKDNKRVGVLEKINKAAKTLPVITPNGKVWSKPIHQFTRDGNYVNSWDCITTAAKSLSINRSHISECVANKRFTAGKYKWILANE